VNLSPLLANPRPSIGSDIDSHFDYHIIMFDHVEHRYYNINYKLLVDPLAGMKTQQSRKIIIIIIPITTKT